METKILQGPFMVCTVNYDKESEKGKERVKEQYAVRADSFTEAEAEMTELLQHYNPFVKDIKRAAFSSILIPEREAERFYRVKVKTMVVDERTGKEKTAAEYYLVCAGSTAEAETVTTKTMRTSIADHEVESIVETKITEILYHND